MEMQYFGGMANTPERRGKKLRRYWLRGLVGVVVPLGIASFYTAIWAYWLQHASCAGDICSGPAHAQRVYYLWFVIGVFGLSLSEYGLAGAEAGMLMHPAWKAPNAQVVMMHCDKTWSGPGGWKKVLRAIGTGVARRQGMPKSWIALAIPSLLCYICLPLSGITIELAEGYTRRASPAMVIGYNASTFSATLGDNMIDRAILGWQTARLERPPGRGVIYTQSRGGLLATDGGPSVLSVDGFSEVFLAPQAAGPVFGRTWGLMAKYNCSEVRHLDEFTVLSERNGSFTISQEGENFYPVSGGYIVVRNQSNTGYHNINAWLEVGTSTDLIQYRPTYYTSFDGWGGNDYSSGVEYPYDGLGKPNLLEVALWQIDGTEVPYRNANHDLGTTIPELLGAYKSVRKDPLRPWFDDEPPAAIGVRCISQSGVGYADINGLDGTFSGFDRLDVGSNATSNFTQPYNQEFELFSTPHLSYGAFLVFLQKRNAKDVLSNDTNWLRGLWGSIEADLYLQSVSPLYNQAVIRPITSGKLRRSLIQAFGSYAAQLMYAGTQLPASEQNVWKAVNLTTAEKGRILRRGFIHPAMAFTPLLVWSISSAALSLSFSFRRRWADILGGYSLFRFGADVVPTSGFDTQFCAAEYENCGELRALPGLIGDCEPHANPGHITLVHDDVARPTKRYK